MGHHDFGRKLGRTSSHRKALLRNMATALVKHKEIKTTHEKAKELQRYIEKAITEGIKVRKEKLSTNRLHKFFYNSDDITIRGRNRIKHYADNILNKDEQLKFINFLKDPANAEKPELVVKYVASDDEGRKKGSVRILKIKGTVNRFMEEVITRYSKNPSGGYTRVFRLGNRKGDNAKVAVISLTLNEVVS